MKDEWVGEIKKILRRKAEEAMRKNRFVCMPLWACQDQFMASS